MKSSHRPPLNLSDPEPGEDQDEFIASTTEEPLELEPTPQPERPMSERRRRRLMEEQRLAEERTAAALNVAMPDLGPLAVSADAPPAALETQPPAPAPVASRRAAAAPGGNAYLIAGIASALWIGGVASWAAYEFGAGGAELDPLRIAIYALIALAPAGLAIMLAHAVRQGAGLAAETRRARQLAEALVAPTALAAQQTGDVLQSLRSDIDHAALAAERARTDMALLRDALAEETARLNEAADNAGRTARRLAEVTPIDQGLEEIYLTHWMLKTREYLTVDNAEVKAMLGKDAPADIADRLVEGTRLGDSAFRAAALCRNRYNAILYVVYFWILRGLNEAGEILILIVANDITE